MTIFIWAIATACVRPCNGRPTATAAFLGPRPSRWSCRPSLDAVYGYGSVNVEAQAGDPHSLLNWTRRMLAVRKGHRAFGRGAQRFLYPGNRKILAFLREFDGQTILCVSNLSRTAQAVELNLAEFAGHIPVDLIGGSAFPPIGQLSYLLTLPALCVFIGLSWPATANCRLGTPRRPSLCRNIPPWLSVRACRKSSPRRSEPGWRRKFCPPI